MERKPLLSPAAIVRSIEADAHDGDDSYEQIVERPGWLYGMNPVLEALRAGAAMKAVYVYGGRQSKTEELYQEAERRGLEVRVQEDSVFFDEKFPKGHQGVAAEWKPAPALSIEELMAIPAARGQDAFFVILDEVDNPRNLGAIIRSAEAAGVHGIVTQVRRSATLGPEALKTSAGAAALIPLCTVTNIKNAMRYMHDEGIMLIGAEASGETLLWKANLTGPVALVIGSEGRGLRRTVAERCDTLVHIPMAGAINSLNASVAAALMLFERVRQTAG